MTDEKEVIAKKYFKEIKPKHLQKFTTTTPQGNTIEGYICKKANHFLGSMLITKVSFPNIDDGVCVENVNQFIQSMPKIHYYDYHHTMYQDNDIVYNAYEKLDGSCLILYGLYYKGELVEIVPKTRGVPVADKHIIEMYDEIDHANIIEFFEKCKADNPTLLFELFGTLNQHSIFYPRIRIDINLIGATLEGEFVDWYLLDTFSKQFDFILPDILFTLIYTRNTWKVHVDNGFIHHYAKKGNGLIRDGEEFPTQLDAINAIKDCITIANKEYAKVHNHSLLEGVVINSWNSSGDYILHLKVKSADIEERCKTENGIPRKFILKEVQKYFDEYGSEAKEIYKKDETHYYDYVMKNLSEEFDTFALENKRTKSRVKNVFLDMLEAKQPPEGLQEICNNLKDEYPGATAVDLIRIFAQEYPEKKRQANMAFSIFEKIT